MANLGYTYDKNDEQLVEGDRIIKEGGDYTFEGEVVSILVKRGGHAVRVVAEDDRGLLFIFNPDHIRKVNP